MLFSNTGNRDPRSVRDFEDADIRAEYERRFGVQIDVIGEVYRRLAEGDVGEAMDVMAREFDLAPAYCEIKIAGLLARTRGHSHAEN